MKYLAIDTCATALTVLIDNEGQVLEHHDPACGVNHSVKVMPTVENLIQKSSLNLKDVQFIASVIGPGSFTGIRIGVSTVKALCFAFNKKALAITSFDTLAYNEKGGKVLAVINAGHGGFYACGYNDQKVCLQPCYILFEQLLALSKEYLVVSNAQIEGLAIKTVCPVLGLKNAIALKSAQVIEADGLEPLYVRKSQAEEGRP